MTLVFGTTSTGDPLSSELFSFYGFVLVVDKQRVTQDHSANSDIEAHRRRHERS